MAESFNEEFIVEDRNGIYYRLFYQGQNLMCQSLSRKDFIFVIGKIKPRGCSEADFLMKIVPRNPIDVRNLEIGAVICSDESDIRKKPFCLKDLNKVFKRISP